MDEFLPSRKASKILGVHPSTLRKLDADGEIQTIRTPGNKRLYNVQGYINKNISFKSNNTLSKISICYCRVSTPNQKDDLQRQVEYLQKYYPSHQIITDIGSGINFKRKGLKTILDLAYKGSVQEVVVAYKDRLCRFGYELIEYILQSQSDAKIVVLNETTSSPKEEVVEDLLQIISVFGT